MEIMFLMITCLYSVFPQRKGHVAWNKLLKKITSVRVTSYKWSRILPYFMEHVTPSLGGVNDCTTVLT